MYTNILNWPLNLNGKKKPYLAKTLTEPIDLMALLSAPNPNANFACNNQRQQLTALWSNGNTGSGGSRIFFVGGAKGVLNSSEGELKN